MPDDLGPIAREVWQRLAPSMVKQGILTEWDGEAFATYREAVEHSRVAAAVIREQGILGRGQRGEGTKNPALQIFRDSAMTIKALGTQFGLTPASRASLTMAEDETHEDLTALLS